MDRQNRQPDNFDDISISALHRDIVNLVRLRQNVKLAIAFISFAIEYRDIAKIVSGSVLFVHYVFSPLTITIVNKL